jgi:transposase InsO family protein
MKGGIAAWCGRVGRSRQNYYQGHRRRQRRRIDADLVEQLVRRERAIQPRLGGRKLHYLCAPDLEEAGVRIGRDRFFEVLAEKDLLLEPLPRKPRTTDSRHALPVFGNLVKDLALRGPNEAWAADLTYLRTGEGFLYLSLLTDMYSRKIVGFHAGDTLETEGCLKALEMALGELPAGVAPVHHSDRGSQYCSHLYVEAARKRGLAISMTEEYHCYENALAERVNGILKQEYWLGCRFRTKRQALAAVAEAVWLYNTRRPHQALKNKTPESVHRRAA